MWKDLNEDTKSQVEFKTRFFVCVRVCVPYKEFAVRRVRVCACVCVCASRVTPDLKIQDYATLVHQQKCKLLLTPHQEKM